MSGPTPEPQPSPPWGAPPPQANSFNSPAMPAPLGAPPPPPAQNLAPPPLPPYMQPGYAQSYMPPPGYMPPPPPGSMPAFGIPRPQSGKAVASLICGGVGLVLSCMYLPVLAIPVGLVLGILAIAETGPEGTRSGRGLAITGTVLNSVLLVGIVAAGIGLYSLSQHVEATNRGAIDSTTEHDFKLIRERLREYYLKNDKSLASGGPVLAKYLPHTGGPKPRGRGPAPANAPAPKTGSMVTAELRLEDLVGENELQASLSLYEFQVTGRASALVRFNSWDHASNRLMTVFDIGRDQFSITQE